MTRWQRAADLLRTGINALLKRSDPEVARIVVSGNTAAGVHVTPDTALRQAVVWACITYLSRTVAQLPWRVMTDTPVKGEVTTHPVHRLLRVRPNPEMGPFTFKETMVGWACSWGNAVAEIERDNSQRPIGLWPLDPRRVDFVRDGATGELLYEIWSDGEPRSYLRADQVLHLRGYGDGPVGLSVMAYAAESIGWARATEIFGAAYFGQGVHPSGLLALNGKLTPEGKKVLEDDLATKFSGPRNAHRTLVVDFDAKYTRFSPDPEAAQLVETRQHQVEEICRWFGVPPHKVMHLLRSTFSNIEHQSIEVVVDSITPWALRLEEEADYKLFNGRAGLYTKLDLKGLLRGAYKDRQEGLQIMRRNGVINANEWRALEDMNPIGPEGDKYVIEGNMTTLERIGEESPDARYLPDDDSPDALVERARRQRDLAKRNLH